MQSSDQSKTPTNEFQAYSASGSQTASAVSSQETKDSAPKKDVRFPEHESGVRGKPSFKEIAFGFGHHNSWHLKCQAHVKNVLRNSYQVKLLTEALSSVGCKFDISRHVSCEMCDPSVGGGYDAINQQVVVCQNVSLTEQKVTSVLAHELIHAYDFCRMNFSFGNIDHVACSEIRASTQTHCSFVSAVFQGTATPWAFKNRHKNCVKMKATESVMSAKNVSLEVALASVEKVFPQCYADLEPFGRIPRRNSRDTDKSYYERFYYGYGS